jgi:hypothetical protein
VVALYAVVLGAVAIGFALLAGASAAGDPWLIGRGLFFSALSGVAAVACAFRATGRRVRPWGLTVGLLPAVAELLWLATR